MSENEKIRTDEKKNEKEKKNEEEKKREKKWVHPDQNSTPLSKLFSNQEYRVHRKSFCVKRQLRYRVCKAT